MLIYRNFEEKDAGTMWLGIAVFYIKSKEKQDYLFLVNTQTHG